MDKHILPCYLPIFGCRSLPESSPLSWPFLKFSSTNSGKPVFDIGLTTAVKSFQMGFSRTNSFISTPCSLATATGSSTVPMGISRPMTFSGKVVKERTFCYQCANQRHLPFKKVKDDIDKLVKNNLIPDCLILVCNRITDNMRTLFKSYAGQFGIKETEVWSGAEFEEKLRKDTPEIFKRFVEGQPFPEVPA
jgi:hypothetical protein